MSSSADPSCSNAVAGAGHKYKSTAAAVPCSALEQAFIPVASEVSPRPFDHLPSKQVVFFCSMVVRPEPWRRPIIKQKKEPLNEGAR